jgi:hypothetical protein
VFPHIQPVDYLNIGFYVYRQCATRRRHGVDVAMKVPIG